MTVSESPLGTGCGLEVVSPELNEALGLVAVPRVAETTQVGMLKIHPGVVEKTVEESVGTQCSLGPDQGAVRVGE
jgi:hypothetical protein